MSIQLRATLSLLILSVSASPALAGYRTATIRQELRAFNSIYFDARNSRGGNGDVAAAYLTAMDLLLRLKYNKPIRIIANKDALEVLSTLEGRKVRFGGALCKGRLHIIDPDHLPAGLPPADLVVQLASMHGDVRSLAAPQSLKVPVTETTVYISQTVLGNTEATTPLEQLGAIGVGKQALSISPAGLAENQSGIYADHVALMLRDASRPRVIQYLHDAIKGTPSYRAGRKLMAIIRGNQLEGARMGFVYGISMGNIRNSSRSQFLRYLEALSLQAQERMESYVLLTPSLFPQQAVDGHPELTGRVHVHMIGDKLPQAGKPGHVYIVRTGPVPHSVFTSLMALSQLPAIIAGDGAMSAAIALGKPFAMTSVDWNIANIRAVGKVLADSVEGYDRSVVESLFLWPHFWPRTGLGVTTKLSTPQLERAYRSLLAKTNYLTDSIVRIASRAPQIFQPSGPNAATQRSIQDPAILLSHLASRAALGDSAAATRLHSMARDVNSEPKSELITHALLAAFPSGRNSELLDIALGFNDETLRVLINSTGLRNASNQQLDKLTQRLAEATSPKTIRDLSVNLLLHNSVRNLPQSVAIRKILGDKLSVADGEPMVKEICTVFESELMIEDTVYHALIKASPLSDCVARVLKMSAHSISDPTPFLDALVDTLSSTTSEHGRENVLRAMASLGPRTEHHAAPLIKIAADESLADRTRKLAAKTLFQDMLGSNAQVHALAHSLWMADGAGSDSLKLIAGLWLARHSDCQNSQDFTARAAETFLATAAGSTEESQSLTILHRSIMAAAQRAASPRLSHQVIESLIARARCVVSLPEIRDTLEALSYVDFGSSIGLVNDFKNIAIRHYEASTSSLRRDIAAAVLARLSPTDPVLKRRFIDDLRREFSVGVATSMSLMPVLLDEERSLYVEWLSSPTSPEQVAHAISTMLQRDGDGQSALLHAFSATLSSPETAGNIKNAAIEALAHGRRFDKDLIYAVARPTDHYLSMPAISSMRHMLLTYLSGEGITSSDHVDLARHVLGHPLSIEPTHLMSNRAIVLGMLSDNLSEVDDYLKGLLARPSVPATVRGDARNALNDRQDRRVSRCAAALSQ